MTGKKVTTSGRSVNQKRTVSVIFEFVVDPITAITHSPLAKEPDPKAAPCLYSVEATLTDPNQHDLLCRTVAISRTGQGQLRVNLGISMATSSIIFLRKTSFGGSLPLEV